MNISWSKTMNLKLHVQQNPSHCGAFIWQGWKLRETKTNTKLEYCIFCEQKCWKLWPILTVKYVWLISEIDVGRIVCHLQCWIVLLEMLMVRYWTDVDKRWTTESLPDDFSQTELVKDITAHSDTKRFFVKEISLILVAPVPFQYSSFYHLWTNLFTLESFYHKWLWPENWIGIA